MKLSHWIIKSRWVTAGNGRWAGCLDTESQVVVLIPVVQSDWCPPPLSFPRSPFHLSSAALSFTWATINCDWLLQQLHYHQRVDCHAVNAIVTITSLWWQCSADCDSSTRTVCCWFGLIGIKRFRSFLGWNLSVNLTRTDACSASFLRMGASFNHIIITPWLCFFFSSASAKMSPFMSFFFFFHSVCNFACVLVHVHSVQFV